MVTWCYRFATSAEQLEAVMSHRLDKHAVQFRAIGARGEYHVESRGLALWFREKYGLARVEAEIEIALGTNGD
jgi:hypothetical protein